MSKSPQPKSLTIPCNERSRLGDVFANIATQYIQSIVRTSPAEGGAFEGERNRISEVRIARELALNALQEHEREHECGVVYRVARQSLYETRS